jgi:hypothetical protein
MDKKINTQLETYIVGFKDDIKMKLAELNITEKDKVNELLEYVYEYPRLAFSKEDFSKRRRIQNTIPVENRCNAMKSTNERCTRRRKDGSEYCGTHTKNVPHGDFCKSEHLHKDMEVIATEINGIVYFVDEYKNVYKTEDILNNIENPKIIAKYDIEENGKKVFHAFSV